MMHMRCSMNESASNGAGVLSGGMTESDVARLVGFVLRSIGAEMLRIASIAGGRIDHDTDASTDDTRIEEAASLRLLAGKAADGVAVAIREAGRALLRDGDTLARVVVRMQVSESESEREAAGVSAEHAGAAAGKAVALTTARASIGVEVGVRASHAGATGATEIPHLSAGHVVVVGKLPVPGHCKTRLAAELRVGVTSSNDAPGASIETGPDAADRAAVGVARACLLVTCANALSVPDCGTSLLCALPGGADAEGTNKVSPSDVAAFADRVLSGSPLSDAGGPHDPAGPLGAVAASLASDLEAVAPGVKVVLVAGGRSLSGVLAAAVLRSQMGGFGVEGDTSDAVLGDVDAVAADRAISLKCALGAVGGAFGPTMLLGADCPLVPQSAVGDALARCRSSGECVVLPASDGGYVALALPWFAPAELAFDSVRWSLPSTGCSQVAALLRCGMSAFVDAGVWEDVDGLSGLRSLSAASSGDAADFETPIDAAAESAKLALRMIE